MEGLIPFVYKAIVQYRSAEQQATITASWFQESPSASYIRLPTGDSGRFQSSDIQLIRSSPSDTSHLLVCATTQSPLHRLVS
ncbi:hypothetical protein ACHQM5_008869 [Ranunculus cassubicifolius]